MEIINAMTPSVWQAFWILVILGNIFNYAMKKQ